MSTTDWVLCMALNNFVSQHFFLNIFILQKYLRKATELFVDQVIMI